jgi:hypothetical protein
MCNINYLQITVMRGEFNAQTTRMKGIIYGNDVVWMTYLAYSFLGIGVCLDRCSNPKVVTCCFI